MQEALFTYATLTPSTSTQFLVGVDSSGIRTYACEIKNESKLTPTPPMVSNEDVISPKYAN